MGISREEAISILEQRQCCRECVTDCTCKECDDAFDMAIKALEQDQKEIYAKGFEDGQKALYEHLELCKAEQEPKTGHWLMVSDGYGDNAYICECSECKDTVWVYKDADRKWNYCPNCGAKMEG